MRDFNHSIKKLAKLLNIDLDKIDEEIENKDNIALNMIIDKVKELKFENKKLQKSKQFLANMLKIKDEEQPKDLHIIKQEFDKIYDKTRVYYEKEITELGEVIAGLKKELDYYKNVVKKYNGKIIS
jgi:plasmid maintenance system antidote protein VapI